jgi:hypothetical protein
MSITNQFRVNTVTFAKADGTSRTMNYIRFADLPQQITSTLGAPRTLSAGRELVWDVDANNFRVVNFNTQVGSISTSTRAVTITRA